MERKLVAGSAPSGLNIMYAALCLMMLGLIAFIIITTFPTQIGIVGLAEYFKYLEICSWVIVGSQVLFVVGAVMCIGLARQTDLAALFYISLVIWVISLALTFYRIFATAGELPAWVDSGRSVASLIAIVTSLFFWRVVADHLQTKKLINQARNALQVCIGMMVLWGIYIALFYVDKQLFVDVNMLFGLGLLLGTLIAFVQYANLLRATAKELVSPTPPKQSN